MNVNLLSDLKYLEEMGKKILTACTYEKDTAYGGENRREGLLLPGGDNKYASFWVRDCSMSCLSGLVSEREMRRYLTVMASCGQNGEKTLWLKNGLRVPPWTLADHVNYNGRPVWYPGTYSDGDDQGKGDFGIQPPLDDNYWFILFAAQYVGSTEDREILREDMSGTDLITRLEKAWEGYDIEEGTGLCTTDEASRAVDWGFTDTIGKTGKLLFASILRYNAALALAELEEGLEEKEKAENYRNAAGKLRKAICDTFLLENGWMRSATGKCDQIDVWGTVYAVWSGILTEEQERITAKTVLQDYMDGNLIGANGYLRQIRRCDDAEPGKRAWEAVRWYEGQYDWYQNGAYWATPSGWLFWTLYLADRDTAFRVIRDFCSHTREHEKDGAPFEWINTDTTDLSGLLYGTSASLPYLGVLRIAQEEQSGDKIFGEERRGTIRDVCAAQNGDTFTFALLTDTHLSDIGEMTAKNIHEVDNSADFRCTVHMGDFLNGYNPPKLSARLLHEEIDMYAAATKTGAFLPTQGNHDGYRDETWDGQNIPSAKLNEWYRMQTDITDRIPGVVRHGNDPFYYADFPEDKVRIVILCSMDYAFDPEIKHIDMWDGFSTRQVKWFASEALRGPEGWTILVFSHIPPVDHKGEIRNGGEMVALCQALLNRGTAKAQGETWDFSDSGTTIAAWGYGHVHGDVIRKEGKLNLFCTASETAYIPQLWDPEPGGYYPAPRTIGTAGEDLWDACVLDKGKRELKLFRFGAGMDRSIKY